MKKFLILLLIAPFSIWGQKDFDYTVFTTKSDIITKGRNGKDTMNLFLLRIFKKEANVLKCINPTNTGDTKVYELEYIGYQEDEFIYNVLSINGRKFTDISVRINPITPLIIISNMFNEGLGITQIVKNY
jgi:hypothetical protein